MLAGGWGRRGQSRQNSKHGIACVRARWDAAGICGQGLRRREKVGRSGGEEGGEDLLIRAWRA